MASKKGTDDFEARVEERMQVFLPFLESLQGIRKPLVEDTVHDYCRVCVQLDEVQERVLNDGTTIIAVNGNKVKNPDVTTMHGFINEKNAMLPKIIKFMSEGEAPAEDDFDAFLKNG